jgi:hypothetical protein
MDQPAVKQVQQSSSCALSTSSPWPLGERVSNRIAALSHQRNQLPAGILLNKNKLVLWLPLIIYNQEPELSGAKHVTAELSVPVGRSLTLFSASISHSRIIREDKSPATASLFCFCFHATTNPAIPK